MDSVKKYIIVTGGDGGYGNLGDEWLREAALSHYENILEKYKVLIVIANIPSSHNKRYEYVKDTPEAFAKLAIKVDDIAALHYYGGGYLNSYWMKEKLWLYDLLTKQGLTKDKIFFTGQGLGPFDNEELKEVQAIARSVQQFGTRDRYFVDSVGGSFMFDESVTTVRFKKPRRYRRNELWVNFRIASHVGANETKLTSLLDKLQRFAELYNLHINYFAMINNEELDERAEMIRLLKNCGAVEPRVLNRPTDYNELMNLFNRAAMVVTTSYHATLAALYRGVPAVAVFENEYYRLKFKGLKDVFNCSQLLTLLNLQSYTAREVVDALSARDIEIADKIAQLKDLNKKIYQDIKRAIDVDVLAE